MHLVSTEDYDFQWMEGPETGSERSGTADMSNRHCSKGTFWIAEPGNKPIYQVSSLHDLTSVLELIRDELGPDVYVGIKWNPL